MQARAGAARSWSSVVVVAWSVNSRSRATLRTDAGGARPPPEIVAAAHTEAATPADDAAQREWACTHHPQHRRVEHRVDREAGPERSDGQIELNIFRLIHH